jgi:hypothetical protein
MAEGVGERLDRLLAGDGEAKAGKSAQDLTDG